MRVKLLLASLALAGAATAIPWPIPPTDAVHPVGNNWGEYQDYGGGPYFHNGVDCLTPDTQNVEVRAVAHGWVKGWGTIEADLHYRLAVCDTNSSFTGRAPGWLYAHIDPDLPHKQLGDEVQPGEVIGRLVWWGMDATFDHIHFARISDTGATWMRFPDVTWWFIENPMLSFQPNTDNVAPVFENARPGRRFAICRDNSSTYQAATAVTGDVDIIARVYDETGCSTGDPTWDRLAPYQVDYSIRSAGGTVVLPWTIAVQFSNRLDGSLVNVVYKADNTCRSEGDYWNRNYYFIITNNDGDSVIEASDANGRWASASVPDGDYWVLVRASDAVGNTTLDSMLVTTDNGVGVEEVPLVALSRPLRAFPNPGPGPARISFGLVSEAMGTLRVIDVAGRVVRTFGTGRFAAGDHAFTVRDLPPGVFRVELSLGDRDRYIGKLVIAR